MSRGPGQMRLATLIAALVFLIAGAAQAAGPITGRAKVIDGKTIEINSERIRLAGLAAFEPDQVCLDATGERYPCGQRSAQALADLIGVRPLTCVPNGEGFDPIVAVCWLNANDLGAWLVLEGWAVDDGDVEPDYSAEEAAAERTSAGAWAGKFEPPSQWLANR